jgi:hypothetical protein
MFVPIAVVPLYFSENCEPSEVITSTGTLVVVSAGESSRAMPKIPPDPDVAMISVPEPSTFTRSPAPKVVADPAVVV